MTAHLITLTVLLFLVSFVEPAEASGLSFGDGLAIFLCFGLTIIGVLACLGRHSRRMSSGQF